MKPPREVYIQLEYGMWFVRYVHRRKGQRYLAAQFNAHHYTEDTAKTWVLQNPKLKLVPPP